MAFWKKSEDPWDIKPARAKRHSAMPASGEQETEPSIADEVRELLRKKPKEEETPPLCPWCGKEMEGRYLSGDRRELCLTVEKPGAFFGTMFMEAVTLTDGGAICAYKRCWQCVPCRKLVVDLTEEMVPGYGWAGGCESGETEKKE